MGRTICWKKDDFPWSEASCNAYSMLELLTLLPYHNVHDDLEVKRKLAHFSPKNKLMSRSQIWNGVTCSETMWDLWTNNVTWQDQKETDMCTHLPPAVSSTVNICESCFNAVPVLQHVSPTCSQYSPLLLFVFNSPDFTICSCFSPLRM